MAGQDFRSSRLWRIFRPCLPTLRVSLTDDAGNSESVTIAATEAVAAIPLGWSCKTFPADTTAATPFTFTFRIASCEGMAISYKDFRAHSFDTTGGAVTGTKRVDLRKDLWEIPVEPESSADVIVVLSVTGDCADHGRSAPGTGRRYPTGWS